MLNFLQLFLMTLYSKDYQLIYNFPKNDLAPLLLTSPIRDRVNQLGVRPYSVGDARHCQPHDRQHAVSTWARRMGFIQKVEWSLVIIYLVWELLVVLLVFVIINGTMADPTMAKDISSKRVKIITIAKVEYLVEQQF